MIEAAETALSDIETTAITYGEDGCMIYPEQVHILVSKDYERKLVHVFGPSKDHIAEGVDFLERSKLVVFHNGRGFDEPVLQQNFGMKRRDDAHFIDSLILCQLFYSNVKEEEDFQRFEKHKMRPASATKFTGDLIGRHSLEAWGLRLNTPRPKGNYSEIMKAQGIDPWAAWNPEMQDYAIQDVDTLEGLWEERLKDRITPAVMQAISVEHYLAELMEQVKKSGIKLDVAHANKIADALEKRSMEIEAEIRAEFPARLEPIKWKHYPIPLGEPWLSDEDRKELDDKRDSKDETDKARVAELISSGPPQRLTPLMWEHKNNDIYRPRFSLPEGYQREQWGEAFTPKVNRVVKNKAGEVLYTAVKDAPFTKCELTEINPGSRPQIIRRLLELGWTPTEFTDTGNPETSEAELGKLEEEFPAAKNIAKYLLIQKRLGALKTGKKAWLNLVDPNGMIHPSIHACNTVTFRATHSDPNISQVPSVKMKDVLDTDGKKLTKKEKKLLYKFVNGAWDILEDDFIDKVIQAPRTGEDGKWGWDCRECFTVPEGFVMVGSDLAGIEMRCWAHYLWKYDDGRFADIILNKDVHEENRIILGFADRRKAKEWLYAMMYGGGDEKLGFIIDPLASPEKQKMLGRQSRSRFMAGMIGYEALNDELMLGVRRGYLKGIDGRRCPVRKQHAALNTLLQSAGAIISKYWIIFTLQILEDEMGLKWGYDNDFTLMLYSHDELQIACRPQFAEQVKDACTRAAIKAGQHLKFRLPVEVGVVDGPTWAHTH